MISVELDEPTAARVHRLAQQWHVSPSEVVDRALQQVEEIPLPVAEAPLPLAERLARMNEFYAQGGLDPKVAEKWLQELEEDRHAWGSRASV